MQRFHLIEIEDQPWCPQAIRDGATDYLEQVINLTNLYGPLQARLRHAISESKTERVLDLCSGGGGPWLRLQPMFEAENFPLEICLTDYYPNLEAFRRAQQASGSRISFHPASVNALQVPIELDGFRTLFSSFHHFKPAEARAIIRDAVSNRRGIGIFEGTERRVPVILSMLLTPLLALVLTPFIRPFRWSRLFWTYLLPLVPLVILFDGIVSCLRTYTPTELQEFTREFADADYTWEVGQERAGAASPAVTYLIGYPRHQSNSA